MSKTITNLYFFGFSRWKQNNTKHFFPETPSKNILFCKDLNDALTKGLTSSSQIYIWGKKVFDDVEDYATQNSNKLYRIEDGFVRSVSLGSDLTKAYSLVVDARGIYFDPSQESDLEYLLNTHDFDEVLIDRAKALQEYLIAHKISKYNAYRDKEIMLKSHKQWQSVVMVVGQVEDDASIRYGAKGMSNLKLLQEARANMPDGYLIYKPHPDVLAGNRKGNIASNEADKYCDEIITEASLDSVLSVCDEVHTMTSLVGFEGLIRGKKVTTYGMPFYAGWGLTTDMQKEERRTKKLKLEELIAGAFILYPRYINPSNNKFCEIETLLEEIDKEKNKYNNKKLYRGFVDIRNLLSRKLQLVIKVILGE